MSAQVGMSRADGRGRRWLERGDRDAHVAVEPRWRICMSSRCIHFATATGGSRGSSSRSSSPAMACWRPNSSPSRSTSAATPVPTTRRFKGAGRFLPTGARAPPWVEFCVGAHIDQASRRLEQFADAGARWSALEELVVVEVARPSGYRARAESLRWRRPCDLRGGSRHSGPDGQHRSAATRRCWAGGPSGPWPVHPLRRNERVAPAGVGPTAVLIADQGLLPRPTPRVSGPVRR